MSEVKETMEDFASELEASYKEYDAHGNNCISGSGRIRMLRKWAELAQQMEDKDRFKGKGKRGS